MIIVISPTCLAGPLDPIFDYVYPKHEKVTWVETVADAKTTLDHYNITCPILVDTCGNYDTTDILNTHSIDFNNIDTAALAIL